MVWLEGCSLADLVQAAAPTQGAVVEQATVQSFAGALGMYHAAIGQLAVATSQYIFHTGLLTDELSEDNPALNVASRSADSRSFLTSAAIVADLYPAVQRARILAQQARGALLQYGQESSRPMIGEMYAVEGYAEVLLAELYCSGIPLSTYFYGDDIHYMKGSSTNEVLRTAIVHLDSALSYGKDSVPIITLATVTQARAYMNLGYYDSAARLAQSVPTNAVYVLQYSTALWETRFWSWDAGPNGGSQGNNAAMIENGEGHNGIQWLADNPVYQDPRIPITTTGTNPITFTIPPRQNKFDGDASVPIASGVAARLIEAEYQLKYSDNDDWLRTLNLLRATLGMNAGIRVLPDTTDPGNTDARTNLIFHERGFWLYLTGTRQGDMRRLIRQYGRDESMVYPSGVYKPSTGFLMLYGNRVVAPVPDSERAKNPLYESCDDYHA